MGNINEGRTKFIFKFTFTILAVVSFSGLVTKHESHAAKQAIVGNPNAPVGGDFRINLGSEPSGLHPLKGTDGVTTDVTRYVFDSLLDRNPETYELEPSMAEKYEVAKDGMSITFHVRDGATFHDGKPVTMEDIKFSFDAAKDPKLSDPARTLYYENLDRAEILDGRIFKVYIKKKYFQNIESAGGFPILPKAYYAEPGNKMLKKMVGSGPYMLDNYIKGQKIILKRNENWWGFKVDHYKGYHHFGRILMSFIKDSTAELETFKKGDLDYIGLSPEEFEKKTSGDKWGKKLIKLAVENNSAKGYTFLAFNLRNAIFQDDKVREAMSLLFNRPMMLSKFFFDKYLSATGPWYVQNPAADPSVKADPFDPAQARKLLAEAGWADQNKDGVLEKSIGGKTVNFKISVIIPALAEWEKYMTVYKEDLKKAGIDLSIKQLEWNAFQKNLDDWNFDLVGLAWRGVVEQDPKQIWHSSSSTKGGSNFAGYNNPKVDTLIDQAREELNAEKRNKILREIYRIIAKDRPYIFLFQPKFGFYAHSDRVQKIKPTYNYTVGRDTWWLTK